MAGDFSRWAEEELDAAMADARPRRRFERNPLDEPAMTAGQLTHGEDKDHTGRLLRALGHDPKDAR